MVLFLWSRYSSSYKQQHFNVLFDFIVIALNGYMTRSQTLSLWPSRGGHDVDHSTASYSAGIRRNKSDSEFSCSCRVSFIL